MKKIIFIASLCSVIFFSCADRRAEDPRLIAIDSLLSKEYCDSAHKALKYIDTSKLRDRNLIYYDLLKIIAELRINKPIKSDSTICKCISYYKKHKDMDKLSWAYLYKGFVLQHLKRTKKAVICFKEAEKCITASSGKEVNIRIYCALSFINTETGNYDTALSYAKKALKEAEIGKNKRFIGYCFDNLGAIFSYKKERDSSNFYIEKSIPYTKYQPLHEQPYFLDNQALCLWRKKRMEQVESVLLKSLHVEPIPHTYTLLAELYSTERRSEKIYNLWAMALKEKRLRFKINTLKAYYKWLKKEGKTEEAFKIAELIPILKDSLAQQQQAEAIKDIQDKYDRKVSENESQIWIIISLSVATMMLVIAMAMAWKYTRTWRREQKAKKEIADNRMMIADYTDLIAKMKNYGREKSTEIKKLQEKLSALQEKQAEILYKGRTLYEDIQNGGTTAKWNKEMFSWFVEYYRTQNLPFVRQLEQEYKSLSNMNQTFLILYDMGYTDQDVRHIMSMEPGAMRTMKSRINGKKIE